MLNANVARPALVTLAAAAGPGVGVLALAVYGTEVAQWFDAAPAAFSAGVIVIVAAVLCGLALLPTHAASLAAGYALGAVAGPVVALVGVTLGSLLGYGFGRLLAGRGWTPSGGRWAAIRAELIERSPARAMTLIVLLRLSPLAPFAATNTALAALRVPILPYLIGAAIGLAPRVAAVAWFGAGLSSLDWQSPQSPWLLVLGGLATVAAVLLTARLAARALRDATSGRRNAKTQ